MFILVNYSTTQRFIQHLRYTCLVHITHPSVSIELLNIEVHNKTCTEARVRKCLMTILLLRLFAYCNAVEAHHTCLPRSESKVLQVPVMQACNNSKKKMQTQISRFTRVLNTSRARLPM